MSGAEFLARTRDDVRAGLRAGAYALAPLDSAVDQALREGLALVSEHYPAQNRRFTVTQEALQDGTLLHLAQLLPDLHQLIALWAPTRDFEAVDYLPFDDGARVLFHVAHAPAGGDELEATYRVRLAVAGLDGAAATTLPYSWHDVWVKAAMLCFMRGEAVRTGTPLDKQLSIAFEGAVAAARTPVRPVRWNRGV